MKNVLYLIFTLFMTSCILPNPHYNWKTPIYSGVVKDANGQRLEGVEVYLKEFTDHKTWSDKNGEFTLPPVKDFEFTTLICPGPCDAAALILNLVALTQGGVQSSMEVYTCIGHPASQCNGRKEYVYITVQ